MKNLDYHNKALVSKWCWWFVVERGDLVGRGDRCALAMRGGFRVGVWKTIQRCWPLVRNKLSFVVGNEQRIKFWKYTWLGATSLYVSSLICLLLLLQRRCG